MGGDGFHGDGYIRAQNGHIGSNGREAKRTSKAKRKEKVGLELLQLI